MKQVPNWDNPLKLGKSAKEFVSGRVELARDTRFKTIQAVVYLAGTSKDDPYRVITLDQYQMSVGMQGDMMTGATLNGGDWGGRIVLARSGVSGSQGK